MIKKLIDAAQPKDIELSPSVQECTAKFAPLIKSSTHGKAIHQKPILVIDNGNYECRAGWSFQDTPFLRFKNNIAKPKTSASKEIDSMHLVGNEINEFDIGKINKRSMFDRNVIYHVQ